MKIKIPYSYIQEYLPSKRHKKSRFAWINAEYEYEFEDFSNEMFPVAYSLWDKYKVRYGEGVFWKQYTEDLPKFSAYLNIPNFIEKEYVENEKHIIKGNNKEDVIQRIREFIEERQIICIENEYYIPFNKHRMCIRGLKIHMPELFPAMLDSEYDVPNNGKTWEDFLKVGRT